MRLHEIVRNIAIKYIRTGSHLRAIKDISGGAIRAGSVYVVRHVHTSGCIKGAVDIFDENCNKNSFWSTDFKIEKY